MEGVVAAKRVEDGRVEIEFPTGTTAELREKEKSRITPLINKAFGREVVTNYLGASGPPYEHGKMCAHRVYPVVEFIIIALLIELDEEENLKECQVDVEAFVSPNLLQHKQSDFYSAQHWLRNKCRYHDIFERK